MSLCVSLLEPTGADVRVLDQMTVTNISDQEALDDFLNSTGDNDMSTGSSLTSGRYRPGMDVVGVNKYHYYY